MTKFHNQEYQNLPFTPGVVGEYYDRSKMESAKRQNHTIRHVDCGKCKYLAGLVS